MVAFPAAGTATEVALRPPDPLPGPAAGADAGACAPVGDGAPDGVPRGVDGVPRGVDGLAGRRIVFLNWRDLDHPAAGGAELFCQSVAERFAAAGARVELLTARPDGSPATEQVRGVALRRAGGTFGVYPAALARLARAARRGGVDAVVDCQNGIPFFSPLVLPRTTPVVQVLHHVHQQQFPLYFPGPAARVGQLLEAPGSRWVYRRRPVAVVSPSTREQARSVLALPGPRFLVPNGVDVPAAPPAPPAPTPTIVCVGRLVPHKRLHLLLDALPALSDAHPGLVVHVVGDGGDRARLTAHASALGLVQRDGTGTAGPKAGDGRGGATVRWHGYASAAVRDELLSTAWLTVNPSHGEGWGLSVLEANAHGVPAVAFRVPGLRDAVRDGHTGWLVDDPDDLAGTVGRALELLSDPATALAWRERARAWAAGFSWDASAELLARVLLAETDRLRAGRAGRAGGARRPGTARRRGRIRRRDVRRTDDAVTVAEIELGGGGLAGGAALARLRRTDLVRRTGPARAVAVLYGAGPSGARAALTRIGAARGARLRPATGEDLLLAAGEAATPTTGRGSTQPTAAAGMPHGDRIRPSL
jgi:glycosyltransferase involved in cell wall biosynthesis